MACAGGGVTIPYCWAAGVSDEVCIARPTNSTKALCGRWIDFLPTVPPVHPHRVHDVCERLWVDGGHVPAPVLDQYGTCPACGGDAPLKDGLVGAHPAWVVGVFGQRPGDEGCGGEGLEPEARDD